MLTIRKEQERTFSRASLKDFENRMVQFFRQFFPYHFSQLGEAGIRGLIELGTARSAIYNIRCECDVARYLTLMISLRPDFDTHGETSWAKPLLTNASLSIEERLDLLLERALEVLAGTRDPA